MSNAKRLCDGGHPMIAVPVGVSVRLVCVECLRGALVVGGRRALVRGSEVKTLNMRDLIAKVELAELTGQFDKLNSEDVPGFDHVFAVCDRAGIPMTAEGLRALVNRVARASNETVAGTMSHSPERLASEADRLRLRPNGAYTPIPVAV